MPCGKCRAAADHRPDDETNGALHSHLCHSNPALRVARNEERRRLSDGRYPHKTAFVPPMRTETDWINRAAAASTKERRLMPE